MKTYDYDRTQAVNYARKWALLRNPKYYDFDKLGGDCTNFVSQCIYSGTNTMNYTPINGWYYISSVDRTASWTGVEFLYNFLTNNNNKGPFAKIVDKNNVLPGDIIQLGRSTGEYYHTLIVSDIFSGKIFVCSHTNDAIDKPLENYFFERIRCLKIYGFKK